ncbi:MULTISPECIES: GNAT family N-acetyltransferase [Gammaproteobacteria]|uniref:GNAT family N-acetyltransferase n=1 Tax=Gammaproteobacteria TaxID=1236 RepID=UPI000DD0076C|nr:MULTISPECIES: GNAT family N-acyltransferase [Gammaproteobacteria]RTE85894.1 GNAT family N-acetyltransferase [Aliidiomarina sp. B3213]TCZ90106.1 GNAT family N-acetyltransferase [Lysobacter sp. N42]
MKPIAQPIPAEALASEFNQIEPLKAFRGLEIYQLHGDECPNIMLEIGRIRELVFRQAGAGRGEERDLDSLDTGALGYLQLVVWDPVNLQIVALYRFQKGEHAVEGGDAWLRTSTLFDYSDEFRSKWLPNAIELGRSVVNPEAKKKTLGFFAVWQGLGALIQAYPQMSCFFGNVTLYKTLGEDVLNTIVGYCETWYAPTTPLLTAKSGLQFSSRSEVAKAVQQVDSESSNQRIQRLKEALDALGERVPPILQSYMGLGANIYMGQTALDADFGEAFELGIVVPIKAIPAEVLEKFTR